MGDRLEPALPSSWPASRLLAVARPRSRWRCSSASRPAAQGAAQRPFAARSGRSAASAGCRSGRAGFAGAAARSRCAAGRRPAGVGGVGGGRGGVARRRLAGRAAAAAPRRPPAPRPRSPPPTLPGRAPAPVGHRSVAALALAWSRQPLQLHGRQRRPGRDDGGLRLRRAGGGGGDRRRSALPALTARARGGDAAAPRRQRAAGAHVHGRRRRGAARLPRGGCSASPAWGAGTWPAWFPLLVFLPFVADATRDARRARAGAASASGRRTSRTTTSGCTSWAPAIAGTLAVYGVLMAGTGGVGAWRALAAGPAAGWSALGGLVRSHRGGCSPALIIIGGMHAPEFPDDQRLQLAGLARLRARPLRGRARVGRDVLAALQPRLSASPYLADMWLDARVDRAAAGRRSSSRFGLYRGLWRFASIVDLQRIVLAAGLGALLIPLVLVMLQLQAVVPRSVLILYPVVLIFLMAGDRFAYRIWKEHRLYSPLAGAGRAGADRRRRRGRRAAHRANWRAAGSGASSACVDDDPAKQRPAAARRRACWGRSRRCRHGPSATACAR